MERKYEFRIEGWDSWKVLDEFDLQLNPWLDTVFDALESRSRSSDSTTVKFQSGHCFNEYRIAQ